MKFYSATYRNKDGSPGVILFFPLIMSLILFFLSSCLEPFEPRIDKYENVLVVDGILTDEPGSCEVKLTRTYPYNRRTPIPELGAIVKIVDDLGNEIILNGNQDGMYVPADENFAGEVGRKYKVQVETASGEICESEYEELKPPVPIDEVYYDYVDKGNGLKGLQIFVDTFDPAKESLYYSWSFTETWEFGVPYSSNIYETESVCWATSSSRSFNAKSTKGHSEDRVIGFPLYFIDNTTNRLFIRYSTLVKQYVLTEQTYNFFENLKAINENVGTLYDRTPVILTGNIRNSINPDQPVLGNFQVSGVSEMRLFIDNVDLPIELIIPDGFEYCQAEVLPSVTSKISIDSLRGVGWVVMDTLIYEDEEIYLGLTNSRACFDCTLNGTSLMPEFWYY